MKNLLIIGGTGFIGSSFIRQNLDKYNFVSISRKTPKKKVEKNNIRYLSIDQKDEVNELLKNHNFSYVISSFGEINHDSFFCGGDQVLMSYFNAHLDILSKLNFKNIKQFIHIGSADEYGVSEIPLVEDVRESPLTPYGISRLAISSTLMMLAKTEKLPIKILRVFLPYGPFQQKNKIIPYIINNILMKNKIKLSEGNQKKDFCYISDVNNAISKVLNSNNEGYGIYNVASGKPITIKELTAKIISLMGEGEPLYGMHVHKNKVVDNQYASIKKFSKEFKWSPEVSLEKGIIKMIEYYKAQL